jgi:hypothetical protein
MIWVQANANTNILYLDFKKKAKEQYQKKNDGLQIMIQDNYLVSDQKGKPVAKNSDLEKMNILNMLDNKMMIKEPM